MGRTLETRPELGARVGMPGGFRGTVVEATTPELAAIAAEYPDRVWVRWDPPSGFSQLLAWSELGPEEVAAELPA